MRQCSSRSGASLNEAIRNCVLIVALQQLRKERLPARAPWRDNEFWHTKYMVFNVVRWRAARQSSLSFRKTLTLLCVPMPQMQNRSWGLLSV
jgi:hypothetical protein